MSLDRTEILHKRGEIGKEVDEIIAIIDGPEFQEISDDAKILLLRQCDAMVEYHKILCDRIKEIDNQLIGKLEPEAVDPDEQLVKPFLERLKAWWGS